MTCEKCYHNEVCKALYELNGIPRIGATECAYFRDKDHLIESPNGVHSIHAHQKKEVLTNEP